MKNIKYEDKLLKIVNSIKITKDDLLKVIHELAKRHEEGTYEPGDAMYIAAAFFHDIHDKGMAVFFRLEALAELIDKINTPGFTRKDREDGSVWTREELAVVAASYPLNKNGNRFSFDAEGFMAKAFELLEPEGNC